ncbi:MAG: SCO family protein [Bacteroidota bacterium]|nr:SCO family protein [Bacteroidota bacterium]
MKVMYCFFIAITFIYQVNAQNKTIEVGIDEQLGKQVPMNLQFVDEYGKAVVLKDLLTKPTVFAFVYFECPGICTPLMNSIAETVDYSDLKPGVNYNIITLSFNERENSTLALNKKKNYMKIITRKDFPDSAWRFLTGDSASIKQLADAMGFHFKRDGKDFIHAGAVMFISQKGIITRYLFPSMNANGSYAILPFDFKMAVLETAQGKVIPTIANVLQFCYSYDPEGKTYVMNFTRIIGAGMLIVGAIFIIFLIKKPKRKTEGNNEGKKNE